MMQFINIVVAKINGRRSNPKHIIVKGSARHRTNLLDVVAYELKVFPRCQSRSVALLCCDSDGYMSEFSNIAIKEIDEIRSYPEHIIVRGASSHRTNLLDVKAYKLKVFPRCHSRSGALLYYNSYGYMSEFSNIAIKEIDEIRSYPEHIIVRDD